mgnify:CR=1 FL=1
MYLYATNLYGVMQGNSVKENIDQLVDFARRTGLDLSIILNEYQLLIEAKNPEAFDVRENYVGFNLSSKRGEKGTFEIEGKNGKVVMRLRAPQCVNRICAKQVEIDGDLQILETKSTKSDMKIKANILNKAS